MMEKEFDINKKILIPKELFIKYICGYYIVLSKEKPNWLVLDKVQYRLFTFLRDNTLLSALEQFQRDSDYSEEDCVHLLQQILSKIDAVNFYEDTMTYEEESIDLIVKSLHITTTTDCNLRCKHCYMAAGINSQEYIDLDKIKQKIKAISFFYGRKLDIVVSGGEPLLHPEIFNFLLDIKSHTVTLFTNGLLITQDNIEYIVEACDAVQVSMEGISKSSFESIRGSNTYDVFLRSLSLLVTSGIKIVLAITVLPSTIEDVKENLVTFIKNLNCENVEVRLNHLIEMTGNARLNLQGQEHSSMIEQDMLDLVKSLENIGISYENKAERNIRFTNCGIGASIVFEPNGKIYPCSKYSDFYKTIDDDTDDIIEYFDSLNIKSSCKYMVSCQHCELKYICAGGCRIDNYVLKRDMTTPICDNKFKDEQYRRLLKEYLRE